MLAIIQQILSPKRTSGRIWTARVIAVIADAVQIGLLPVFGPGVVSPLEDVLDGVMAVSLILLLGWHWAFLPAFVAELVPMVDLAPTWTAAVLFATRKGATDQQKPAVPVNIK